MEYLALAGAMQLSVFNIDRIHATGQMPSRPERGTGQGDPISVSNWVAVADIPATALRMLDDQSHNPIYVSAEDNQVYKHCDFFMQMI